jgi:hypothetical protein
VIVYVVGTVCVFVFVFLLLVYMKKLKNYQESFVHKYKMGNQKSTIVNFSDIENQAPQENSASVSPTKEGDNNGQQPSLNSVVIHYPLPHHLPFQPPVFLPVTMKPVSYRKS